MRMNDTHGTSALYAGESKHGTIIDCDKCGGQSIDTPYGTPLICVECDEELFYRPWNSW